MLLSLSNTLTPGFLRCYISYSQNNITFENLNTLLKYLEIYTANKVDSEEFLDSVDQFLINYSPCLELHNKTQINLEGCFLAAHLFSEDKHTVSFIQLVGFLNKNINEKNRKNFLEFCNIFNGQKIRTGVDFLRYFWPIKAESLNDELFKIVMDWMSHQCDGGRDGLPKAYYDALSPDSSNNFDDKSLSLLKNPGVWPKKI